MPQAGLDLDPALKRVPGCEQHALALPLGHHIGRVNRFSRERGARGQLVSSTRGGLGAALVQLRRRVFKPNAGLARRQTQGEVCAVVTQLHAARRARCDQSFTARQFPGQKRFFGQLERGIESPQPEWRLRIAVFHIARTGLDVVRQLDLRTGTADPEIFTALIDLVNHANRFRVEVLIETGQRPFEQDAASKHFDFVVGKTRLRLGLENDGRLMAIACQEFDFFAVDDSVTVVQLVRAGGAIGGNLFGQLAERILAGKRIDCHRPTLVLALQAGQGAAVVGQLARLARARGQVIAIEHERLALIDAHVEALGRLRVEPAY